MLLYSDKVFLPRNTATSDWDSSQCALPASCICRTVPFSPARLLGCKRNIRQAVSSFRSVNYVNVPTFRMYVGSFVCLLFCQEARRGFWKAHYRLDRKVGGVRQDFEQTKISLRRRKIVSSGWYRIYLTRLLSRKLLSSTFIISP